MMELIDVKGGADEVAYRAGEVLGVESLEGTFEALYRQRYRDVYRYALLMLRRPEDAEDVASEAFQGAYAAMRSGHGPSGQARGLVRVDPPVQLRRPRRSRRIQPLRGG